MATNPQHLASEIISMRVLIWEASLKYRQLANRQDPGARTDPNESILERTQIKVRNGGNLQLQHSRQRYGHGQHRTQLPTGCQVPLTCRQREIMQTPKLGLKYRMILALAIVPSGMVSNLTRVLPRMSLPEMEHVSSPIELHAAPITYGSGFGL